LDKSIFNKKGDKKEKDDDSDAKGVCAEDRIINSGTAKTFLLF
jgi:hypothetical protein